MSEVALVGVNIVDVLGGGFVLGNWMQNHLSGKAKTIGLVMATIITLIAGIVVMLYQAALNNCTAVGTYAPPC